MVALSEDEHLLSRLFQYRFDQGELDGHSFGNLFVAALSHITGDFAQAVQMSSQILATRGRIFPATNTNVGLAARMDDGSLVEGETNITASKKRIVELMLVPASADPLPETLEAIASADLITLGPGSLYTSLITNLLVRGIPEAIAASKATRVYVCNLMTQANESIGLTASQHIEKILEHASTYGPEGQSDPPSSTTPSSTPAPYLQHWSSNTPAKTRTPSSLTSTASVPWAWNPSPETSSTKATSSATTTTASPTPSLP